MVSTETVVSRMAHAGARFAKSLSYAELAFFAHD